MKRYFVENGYLARSNFLAGLKITMEGKYDLHCMRLSKDVKGDNFTGDVRHLDISFFHRIAQGVKQNKFVPSVFFKLHGT